MSRENSSLRQKAEAKIEELRIGNAKLLEVLSGQSSSEAETQKLIHELQVNQIELEMQNEELQQAIEKAAIAIALYDFAPNGYFTIRPDSTIAQLNLYGAKILGKERLYLRNKELYQFVTTETKPVFTEFLQKCFETCLKQTCEIGLSIQGKPRSFFYLEGMVTEDNRQCLVIAVDITNRKQAEEKLSVNEEIFNQFLENSSIYIFFKDENIRSLRLSRNFEKMLGKPLDELLGKSMFELFPSDLAKSMVEADIQILKSGEEVSVEEEFNGRYYTTVKFPIQVEGKPKFLAGFTIDITEQKLAEQGLKESEANLRELNATKDKFFSIIAHDLKSPFNSIIGFSNLLARQIQEMDYTAIKEYASIIENSSLQAMDLLMNLLEWSRSHTGRIVFTPEKIDITASINQATELFSALALQKSITIYKKIQDRIFISADKAMISTILRNLISNALKFTNNGGKIVISAEQMSNELIVSVMDDGVGIGKDSIGKLFRIDVSYSTLGTQNEKGTGLGLLLCKEFIDKHGGRIWVESEPGKGSKFFFSIPNGS